ncbi:site-specific integrase [Paenibacillus sp. YYML68]|uniref:site-specific integrase n=1 Tax=Paenibacillus sp. YYML68 TaxID=2909250 RepID=UPI00248F9392|nr:site-specific integrase [Paenibacillus sp. YYML68]
MSVKKDDKRGTWYFVVDAGKDDKGKRQQIKRRGFRTESEAKREMRKVQSQVDEKTFVKPTKLTYSEFLTEWLQSKSLKLRRVTLEMYTGHVQRHIVPHLGFHEIAKITSAQVEKFYVTLSEEKGLGSRTVLDIHKILKSSFEAAMKRKYVTSNPVRDAETPKVISQEMSVWSIEEVSKFLESARDDRYYLAFHLALATGMRQSEILGLRWKDIDFDNEVLNVRQTLSHDGKELLTQTKTKSSSRTISIDTRTVNALLKQERLISREKKAASVAYQDNDLVICTAKGTPVSPRNLLRTFYNIIKKAKVPKIRFHDLRHTVATLMLMDGVNPRVVQEILGHSDVKITLGTYHHVLPTVHKDTAKRHGDKIFGNSTALQ